MTDEDWTRSSPWGSLPFQLCARPHLLIRINQLRGSPDDGDRARAELIWAKDLTVAEAHLLLDGYPAPKRPRGRPKGSGGNILLQFDEMAQQLGENLGRDPTIREIEKALAVRRNTTLKAVQLAMSRAHVEGTRQKIG